MAREDGAMSRPIGKILFEVPGRSRLKWFGHVNRRDEHRTPNTRNIIVNEYDCKKTWGQTVYTVDRQS